MKTVRVHIAGQPESSAVLGTGATIAAAVRKAAYLLFNRPGRSAGYGRINSHKLQYAWLVGNLTHCLVVHESRSGPSGKGTKQQVQLRLTPAEVERLDNLADRRHKPRGMLVMALVDAELARIAEEIRKHG